MEKLNYQKFYLSEFTLEVPVPARTESSDVVKNGGGAFFDLSRINKLKYKGQEIFSGMWDWGGGLFSDGPRSLAVTIRVESFPDGVRIGCPGGLKGYAVDLSSKMKALQLKSERFEGQYSSHVEERMVAGRNAARISVLGKKISDRYIVPISEDNFILIDYDYFIVGRGESAKDIKWMEMARGLVDEMVGKIRISGDSHFRCDKQ